jgi:hypothetical protein
MSAEKLTVPLLDIEEPEPPHDAGGAALGRTAVSAAIELMQARLAEQPTVISPCCAESTGYW